VALRVSRDERLDCRNARGREKPYKLADSHGLYLYVTPKGFRSWRWNYRFQGKAGTRTLGTYPELSLANARIARAELDKLRRSGIDPAKAREQALSAEMKSTKFEALARRWHAQQTHLLLPTYAAKILDGLEREVFPYIGHLQVAQIKASSVLAALKPIVDREAYDRAHAGISAAIHRRD
jgi:hypothetical protein